MSKSGSMNTWDLPRRRKSVTVQSGNGINSAFPDDQPLAIYRLSGHLLVHDIGRIASTHGVP
jgi:hypothetical protein